MSCYAEGYDYPAFEETYKLKESDFGVISKIVSELYEGEETINSLDELANLDDGEILERFLNEEVAGDEILDIKYHWKTKEIDYVVRDGKMNWEDVDERDLPDYLKDDDSIERWYWTTRL